jgi:hypothetical protein
VQRYYNPCPGAGVASIAEPIGYPRVCRCCDAKPVLPGVFVVDLHLHPHCFLLPKVRHLFCSSPSSKLYITIGHVALGAVHQALKTGFVFRVIKMLVRAPWVQPGTAQVAEVGFALSACHMVAYVRLARSRD